MIGLTHNFNEFSNFVLQVANQSGLSEITIIRKVALDLLRRIVLRMPVATGRARAGWTVAGSALGLPMPKSEASDVADSDYTEIVNQAETLVRMINNVSYVPFLEYGSSKQAPLGMVRISIAEMVAGESLPMELGQNYVQLWETLSRAGRFAQQRTIFANAVTTVPQVAGILTGMRTA